MEIGKKWIDRKGSKNRMEETRWNKKGKIIYGWIEREERNGERMKSL